MFPLLSNEFELADRDGTLREFRATPDKLRAFCHGCGAPIYSRRENSASVRIRAGLFDKLGIASQTGHIFWPSRAAWDDTYDDLPRFDQVEPTRATR